MRIAFVAYDRPGYHAGPIVNARRLLPELKKRGHEPIGLFIYQDGGAPTVDYLRSQGIECRLRHVKGTTEDKIRWFLEQLADVEPDIFVPNISVSGWFAGRWAREAGIPSIAAMRNDDPFHWDMIRQFYASDTPWKVSGLICVSAELKKRIEEIAPGAGTICELPSGVTIPPVATAKHDPLKLCYVGRVEHTPKNVMFLTSVMCRVLKELPGATAQFVGTGSALEDIQAFVASQSMSERFEFTGSLPIEQVSDHLAGNSVILLASDHEGLPGSLMEAMASGIVPICSAVQGGVLELVRHRHSGLIVESSETAFVSAILELAQDKPRWQEMSRHARNEIVAKYSLTSTADRFIQYCESLLRESGPKHSINIPTRFKLPAVLSGLAPEDRREVGIWRHTMNLIKQKATGLKRRLTENRRTGNHNAHS